MTFTQLIFVAAGGFIGAIARYHLAELLNRENGLPKGTLIVNLVGSFVAGILFGMDLPLLWKSLFIAGVLGAFTTYSTLHKEMIDLWKADRKKEAIYYLLLTYGGGIFLTGIGFLLTSALG